MITIYSRNGCGSCVMVKKFIGMKGRDYEEVNLDDQPERTQEAITLSGVLTVPITRVKDQVIVGYDIRALAKAL